MDFLGYLINGLSLGSVYAIIARGYTMDYGIAKMLKISGLEVSYVIIKAIKGISFEVKKGEIVALIGANGARNHQDPRPQNCLYGNGAHPRGTAHFQAAYGLRKPYARRLFLQGQKRNL